MPTPMPIIAATCDVNSGTDRMFASKPISAAPQPIPKSAAVIGSPMGNAALDGARAIQPTSATVSDTGAASYAPAVPAPVPGAFDVARTTIGSC